MFLLSFSVGAQVGKPNACAEDVGKLCAGKLTQEEVVQCVKANKDKLTGECRKLIFGAEDNARAFHQNCKDDVKKICSHSMTGHAELFECLVRNHKKLSSKCQKSMDKVINR